MAKVLVVGNGGREHAIAYKFHQENHEVFLFGQNAGIEQFATRVTVSLSELPEFCQTNKIDLVFVGPEDFLVNGIIDDLESCGIRAFGPRKNAAILEGSKAFSKSFMKQYHIPTAKHETFTDYEKAYAYLEQSTFPIVIKADGIAAGKGVIIATDFEHAATELKEMMLNQKFNDAGKVVVIEEFLDGEEFSLMCFVSGELIMPMKVVQDHKRAFDGDTGLNTGGMGAYLPVKHITQSDVDEAIEMIIKPTCRAMVKEGREFKGILFAGLMKTKDGVKTIEYNVRFGDPESEIILQSLQTPLFDIANAVIDGKLIDLTWDEKAHVGIVMASKGYPENYEKGYVINGLDDVVSQVYHMGTQLIDNQMCTNGGRVLIVCASGNTFEEARQKAYADIQNIQCDNLFYRNDIGHRSMS